MKYPKKIQFQPKLAPTLVSFFVLCFFIALGWWQVHRYHVKKNLLQQYQKAMQAEPLTLSEISKFSNLRCNCSPVIPSEERQRRVEGSHHCSTHFNQSNGYRTEIPRLAALARDDEGCVDNLRFRQLKVSGHYLNNKTMLLQNRIHQKRVGFEVLTPLKIAKNNKVLLINRGWVPASRGLQAPPINPVNEKQTLTGYIKPIDNSHFTLGKNILNTQQWPLKMQKVDINALSKLTGLQFYPFVLRLAADQPNGFERHWQPVHLKLQHHLGYAAQWFLMALVVLIGYFFVSCHRTDKQQPPHP